MLHDPKEERDKSDRQAVVDYLNHYEYVALGIKKNLLDEEFYKNWMASAFVKDWNTASEFIQRIRWKYNEDTGAWEYKSIVFEHYQDIATKWSKDAVKLAENSQPNHPEKPSGVGDEELPEINNS